MRARRKKKKGEEIKGERNGKELEHLLEGSL